MSPLKNINFMPSTSTLIKCARVKNLRLSIERVSTLCAQPEGLNKVKPPKFIGFYNL